jgi:hypothetical protein
MIAQAVCRAGVVCPNTDVAEMLGQSGQTPSIFDAGDTVFLGEGHAPDTPHRRDAIQSLYLSTIKATLDEPLRRNWAPVQKQGIEDSQRQDR